MFPLDLSAPPEPSRQTNKNTRALPLPLFLFPRRISFLFLFSLFFSPLLIFILWKPFLVGHTNAHLVGRDLPLAYTNLLAARQSPDETPVGDAAGSSDGSDSTAGDTAASEAGDEAASSALSALASIATAEPTAFDDQAALSSLSAAIFTSGTAVAESIAASYVSHPLFPRSVPPSISSSLVVILG